MAVEVRSAGLRYRERTPEVAHPAWETFIARQILCELDPSSFHRFDLCPLAQARHITEHRQHF